MKVYEIVFWRENIETKEQSQNDEKIWVLGNSKKESIQTLENKLRENKQKIDKVISCSEIVKQIHLITDSTKTSLKKHFGYTENIFGVFTE